MSWLTNGPNGPAPSYSGGTTAFSDTLLENIAHDIRFWGGPVDAGGYNLSNLGVLTFNANGYMNGRIATSFGANSVTAASILHSGDGSASAGNVLRVSNGYGPAAGAYEVLSAWGSNFTSPYLVVKDNGSVGIGTASATYQLQLSTDSAGKPSTSTWTVVSDMRTKTGVQPLSGALEKLRALDAIEYNEGETGERTVGVSAQQLQEIMPEAVSTVDGKVAGVTNPLAVSWHHINVATMQAVKELLARVEALEVR